MSDDYQDYSDYSGDEAEEFEGFSDHDSDNETDDISLKEEKGGDATIELDPEPEPDQDKKNEDDNDGSDDVDVELIDNTFNVEKLNTMEKHPPVLTRPICTVYELAKIITLLAEYLESLSDIQKYIKYTDDVLLLNPAEFAFEILKNGAFDANIHRAEGETVTFSLLEVNPLDIKMLESDFNDQNKIIGDVIKVWQHR